MIESCFEIGKEVLAFKSYEELLGLIGKARHDLKAMRHIREAGVRRALAEHMYRHRINSILMHL